MRKLLWIIALCLTLVPAKAQKTPSARKVLDEIAARFTKQGGVKATFKADNFTHGNLQGNASGTMYLQGNKFRMVTPDMTTWYNGETQWSYIKANEEVNVSTPTAEEQQNINPYTFINLYKKGYDLRLKETSLRGKPSYEITLTSQNKQEKLHTIILDIDKNSRELMCIRIQQERKEQWARISIQQFHTGQSFSPKDFEFDPALYPEAEIIDLR